MRTVLSPMVLALCCAGFASLAACALEDNTDTPTDRAALDDTARSADQAIGISPTVLICDPDQIFGQVTDLFVGTGGNVRARGTVFSNIAPCHVSVFIRLTRDGVLIDSQSKSCTTESCTSGLLSAGNPAGDQRFCATVRASANGPVLDTRCFVR